jgi:tetratricopeptide (TPR) repeat protein
MRTLNVSHANLWRLALVAGLVLTSLPATVRADELRDGRNAFQAGQLDEAMKHFEQAASQGVAEGRASVGLVWLKRHNFAKANEAFLLAEKMDNQLAMPHYGVGEVLRQQGKYEEAIPHLQRATELDRRYPEAQLSLSDCLMKMGKYAEAITAANRGLNWGAKWRPRFLIAMGNIAAARDSLRDAGIWYTSAVQEAPEDPATHRALGDFYVKRGTFESAYPEYQAAVARDSLDVDLHFALGQALYYGQRYDAALEEFQWVVARDPEYPAAQLSLGDLLYRAGKADARRYGEARVPLEKYVQLMPDDAKGWSTLGRTYYYVSLAERDTSLKTRALEALDKGVALGDKSKEMYNIRARLHIDRGGLLMAGPDRDREFAAAVADYGLAGDLLPEDMYRLARIMSMQRNNARAESLYSAIVDRDSTAKLAGVAMTEIGKLRFGQAADVAKTDKPGAIPLYRQTMDLFERRIALDPTNDEAYYYVGLCHRELGEIADAITAMRQASAIAPEKPDRHFWLGLLYAQVDSSAQAEPEFQQVASLEGGSAQNRAIALRQLGYYRLLRKDYPGAIQMLEQSAGLNPKDCGTLLWLAQACQNSGNRAKAIEYYRKVLQCDPNNADARNGLKILEGR